MQFIAGQLVGALLSVAGSLVGRVLLALGMGFITFSGFQVGIDWLLAYIKTSLAGMPAEVVDFLAWLWVDKAIGMVFSAYAAAAGLRMAGATSVTKLVHK